MNLTKSILEKNEEAIVFCTNLDQRVSEELLWELFIQAGPVVSVFMPRDKITSDHQGYAFIEFKTEIDALYSIKILHQIKLYERSIKLSKASKNQKIHDIGANIFISNLDKKVDEKKLYETFSNFGPIIDTKIMRDPLNGISKGFGFVHFDNFDASDKSIEIMNNKFFSNNVIKVEYAYKEDTKGERHGSVAERFLASNRPKGFNGIGYGILKEEDLEDHELVVPESLKRKKCN